MEIKIETIAFDASLKEVGPGVRMAVVSALKRLQPGESFQVPSNRGPLISDSMFYASFFLDRKFRKMKQPDGSFRVGRIS